ADRKGSGETKEHVKQVDDLLTFRQFSENSADDPIDYVEDLTKATGAAEVREGFISNFSRISQLTGMSCRAAIISGFSTQCSSPLGCSDYVKMHRFDIMLGMYTSLDGLLYRRHSFTVLICASGQSDA
ncbi:hypothetical protein EDB19DRAFT_1642854, partial [Suillus lakei]